MTITQAQYDAQVNAIAREWRALVDQRIASGWAPVFACDDAANRAARAGKRDEATIQMMTYAAGELYQATDWAHVADFVAWWNARFPAAPRLDGHDFAMPCIIEMPDGRTAAIASSWSAFTREFSPERAQA